MRGGVLYRPVGASVVLPDIVRENWHPVLYKTLPARALVPGALAGPWLLGITLTAQLF
jgi:hypothetical protein